MSIYRPLEGVGACFGSHRQRWMSTRERWLAVLRAKCAVSTISTSSSLRERGGCGSRPVTSRRDEASHLASDWLP